MATTSNKTFDAVEMSRRLREETSRHLASLTAEQRVALLNSHVRQDPIARKMSWATDDEPASVMREEPPKT